MKKLKQYKYIILVVLIVSSFIFYWFQLRPAQIRKECYKMTESSVVFNPLLFAKKYAGESYFDEIAYKKCLREKGLEK